MADKPPLVQPGQAMQGQMQTVQWLSPVMIAIFSFWVTGAMAVYCLVEVILNIPNILRI